MDLSRRDAFRPCSRHSSGDEGQIFVLLDQKKFNCNWAPLPFLGYVFLCDMYFLYMHDMYL